MPGCEATFFSCIVGSDEGFNNHNAVAAAADAMGVVCTAAAGPVVGLRRA